MLQGRTMPSKPAHAASHSGMPVTIHVIPSNLAVRPCLSMSSNNYVGQLRQEVAAQPSFDAPPERLRMFIGGELVSAASACLCSYSSAQPTGSSTWCKTPACRGHHSDDCRLRLIWCHLKVCCHLDSPRSRLCCSPTAMLRMLKSSLDARSFLNASEVAAMLRSSLDARSFLMLQKLLQCLQVAAMRILLPFSGRLGLSAL